MSDVATRLAELVGPALAGLTAAERPAIIALAERIAAGRYRAWAGRIADEGARDDLRACAAREEEIASRVEATLPNAQELQAAAQAAHPELPARYAALFEGLSLAEQLSLQAAAERTGATTWRRLAERADAATAEVYLACAVLELESAEAVETLVASGLAG